MTDAAGEAPCPLTPHVPLRSVEIVVNPKSGGVGAKATDDVQRIMRRFACDAHVVEAEPAQVEKALQDALAAKPDLLVVLAGDGTARAAASMAGPHGPLIAPLPGGTMNLLPKALYGAVDWREALENTLSEGVARPVSGGEVGGRPFYVAAVLGSPALWAPAREAVRLGKPKLAWLYAKRAARRAFSGRVRFRLDGQELHRSEAIAFLSPLVSKALDEPVGLEAAVLNPTDAAEAFRLAARALFSDWRADPSVETRTVRRARAWARTRIPAVLDGEPIQLENDVEVRFVPVAFRALAPASASASASAKGAA
ncbi:diacylglycerol kinase family protein [Caulobacter sp. 17J80-11]|uniref:diacylglycerol/lipid kinase family protein n=1 Tax=Caulobacter sp. 17J80-11 TaxID=2763502 RepID=UPI0016538AA4|nr:diacylglycerol kinase family protein [Caulobacter sp. 17J80-11]MBC6983202.1 NAD(+)/NADH kinase [Caulobacter sp. 17J80-11]